MRYWARTSKGKIRKVNEDSYVIIRDLYDNNVAFAVADGMGGHEFGNVASSVAVNSFKELFLNNENPIKDTFSCTECFHSIFNIINKRILEISREKNLTLGMGTTLSVALITDNKLYTGHIGDSRIYIRHDNQIRQITKDHSYVEELMEKGMITKDEAKMHPKKNMITRALGIEDYVVADIAETETGEGDVVILCTDGLTSVVEDNEILNIINNSNTPEECTQTLIKKANSLGGPDNITVIAGYL